MAISFHLPLFISIKLYFKFNYVYQDLWIIYNYKNVCN